LARAFLICLGPADCDGQPLGALFDIGHGKPGKLGPAEAPGIAQENQRPVSLAG